MLLYGKSHDWVLRSVEWKGMCLFNDTATWCHRKLVLRDGRTSWPTFCRSFLTSSGHSLSHREVDGFENVVNRLFFFLRLVYRSCPSWQGVDPGGLGFFDAWKYVGGITVCFDPLNVTLVHLKLLLDYSASFTSSTMKDLCQRWKVKLIFRGAYRLSGTRIVECLEITDVRCKKKQFDGLTWLTLTHPPPPHIQRQIYASLPGWVQFSRRRCPWPATHVWSLNFPE